MLTRLKFNQRSQEVGESFDAYLTGLQNLAESCNFCTCPNMSDSLLRDHIVLGIRNEDACKRLLQECDLDLRKCVDISGTSQSATTQLLAIGGKREEIHTVNNADSAMKKRGKQGGRADNLNNQMSRKLKCKFWCKSHVLKKESSPAWGKRGNLCGKMNPWKGSEMCEKKDKVHLVSHDSELSDSDSDQMWPLLRRLMFLSKVSAPRKTSQFIVRCVLMLKPSNCKLTVVSLYA